MGKKGTIIAVVAAIVVIVAGVGVYAAINGKKQSDSASNTQTGAATSSKTTFVAVKACDLLTLDEAKTLIGPDAVDGDNGEAQKTEALSVDTCSYRKGSAAKSSLTSIVVMARSALNDEGLQSNKDAFATGGAANQDGAQAVSGYGDKAYWSESFHQLSVLKGTTWYNIAVGGEGMSTGTLDQAKQVADKVF